jgi:hypothetical protein
MDTIKNIWREPDPENPNVFYTKRLFNAETQELRETHVSGGESVDPNNELITTETVTITRHISQKNTFNV